MDLLSRLWYVLFAAFAAEIVVRIPGVNFAIGTSAATIIVMAIGMIVIQMNKKKWLPKT